MLSPNSLVKNTGNPKKKRVYKADTRPNSLNPIFRIYFPCKCRYCLRESHKGRRKVYPNLFTLFMHFSLTHKLEPTYKNVTTTLAEIIIAGDVYHKWNVLRIVTVVKINWFQKSSYWKLVKKLYVLIVTGMVLNLEKIILKSMKSVIPI